MKKNQFPKTMTEQQVKDLKKDKYYSDFAKSLVFNAIQEGKIKIKG